MSTGRCWEEVCLERAWKPLPLPIPCPTHPFHLAVAELYPFITNWQSNKFSIYGLESIGNPADLLDLRLVLEVGR